VGLTGAFRVNWWFARVAVVIAVLLPALLAAPVQAARDPSPLVRIVGAKLVKLRGEAVVTARIEWNRAGIADRREPMTVGDVRVVAVNGVSSRPRLLASQTFRNLVSAPVSEVSFPLKSAAALDAIRPGNRVVITASQHAFAATPDPLQRTSRTYVTVKQLQVGAPRRVGLRDCSAEAVVPYAEETQCDLVGASLARAQVGRLGRRTELLEADLTGADLRDSDLGDVDLAGGRANGANATGADIAKLSLAGADAIGFIAQNGTKITASNFFDTDLTDARFARSKFIGTSLGRSRLHGANFSGAEITGAFMRVADLQDANLRGATLSGDDLYFANFTNAKLRGAKMDASQAALMWTILCRTELPNGKLENRDCPQSGGRRPVKSLVTVDAVLSRGPSSATINALVHWNGGAIDGNNMRIGDVRAVAVDSKTGLPTVLKATSDELSSTNPTSQFTVVVTGKQLDALRPGNRIVVTVTQRPPHPDPAEASDQKTERSYVTVDQLQAGPGLGRVGGVDCSDRPITPGAGPKLQFCDLVGASLADGDLSGDDLRMADLTGADLEAASLEGTKLDGGRLAGVEASRAGLRTASLLAVFAPALQVRTSLISNVNFYGSTLTGSSFTGSRILNGTSFLTALLGGRASLADTELTRVDLAYTILTGGDLSGAKATRTSLFLADLGNATLRGSSWGRDEEGRNPPQSAWLCRTTMPDGTVSHRDCPRR
jgi:uncharacterized protein YjbI with pentapeptide repeats